MKSWLFALGLALCCVVQAEWKEVTITSIKDLGSWITIAVACNSSSGLEQMRSMPAFVAEVSQPEEGVISVLVFFPMLDRCKKVTYQFKKGEDGKYRGFFGDTVVTVESVKVLNKYAMSTVNVNNEFKITTLHGPEATQDPEMLQKFKNKCIKRGYKEDEILVLNPTVKCPKEE